MRACTITCFLLLHGLLLGLAMLLLALLLLAGCCVYWACMALVDANTMQC